MKKNYEPYDWQSYGAVIGVDEAGRGCLAGRVYAAAVYMEPSYDLDRFQDSKTLSEKRREELAKEIMERFSYGIGFASVKEIESVNILNAALLAMKRAVEQIKEKTNILLIDGNQKIKYLDTYEQIPLVKGDQRAAPISAASILAKVSRDQYVYQLAEDYPEYEFERHKAYATKLHKEAIAKWGPCPEHRTTFAGVKEYL